MADLLKLAEKYNNLIYFENDPIIFPRHFYALYLEGKSSLQDIEIAALLCAHLAWGKREMIVRNCRKLMDEMNWEPYNYILYGNYKSDPVSLHRTIKWSEIAVIMGNLKEYYLNENSLENLTPEQIRVRIFGRKPDPKAANKKVHMLRRWMVRKDKIVDIGIWKKIKPADLIIPLDVHVHRSALSLGITKRKSADIITAVEITNYLKSIFPDDPCKGDYALFAHAASKKEE